MFSAYLRYQLALLEAYETNLTQFAWDESHLNEALKAWLASLLPIIRAQHTFSEQMLAAHRDAIKQYRERLQQMMRAQGSASP